MFSETEVQLQKLISTSMIPIMKTMGVDEGSSESDEGQMAKRKATHAEKVEKKLKRMQSTEENYMAILAERKRALLKSPVVPTNSGGLRESDLDYSSDSSSDGGNVEVACGDEVQSSQEKFGCHEEMPPLEPHKRQLVDR